MLQLVVLLDSSRAPRQLLDEVETLQAGNVQDDDDARQGTATGRRSAWEWRRCSPQLRDGNSAALGEGMATAWLWERGWRRCGSDRGDGDGATLEQKTVSAIFLSMGSSR